ncbi:hypothetical protein [Roseobacter sp. CCS2]|uniref:hypothetical protein n=1 Tax=Roseobacter sp. CCS2 TaxID=391593 RepID=UPI0012EAB5AC|nr:hypothetical protein [Roseobacter sp. CCS2]
MTMSLAACTAQDISTPPAPALVDEYRPTTRSAQVEELRVAVARYSDFAVARREGWRPFGDDEPLMGTHYYNESAPDYVAGDALDFSRPNNLMYTEIGGQQVLTGVAFVVRIGPGESVPDGFAGSMDRWHVHDFVAAIDAAAEERPILGGIANWWLDQNYRNKGDNRGRLAMVHAWVTLENPDGMFADFNRTLPYRKLDLPERYWQGASIAAARGLNLATDGGCDTQNGTLWIANVTRSQDRAIKQACRIGADEVRSAISEGGKSRINTAGEQAWARFDAVWQQTLTPTQRRRIAAMSEHGGDGHEGMKH